MAEYIDKEVALSLIKPDTPEDEKAAITIATAKELVRSIVCRTPAADVVPVVRCANCMYLDILNDKVYYARCKMTNTVFESFKLDTRTHYCSLGRKKENK